MNLDQKINNLIERMNAARIASDKANNLAYELRQIAVREGFEATAAAENAAQLAELVNASEDDSVRLKLIHYSKQAASKAAEATLKALQAIEAANLADHEVTEAFRTTREAAEKLSEALTIEGY